jgi:drug/metabolite transporter (DMT)-like permease
LVIPFSIIITYCTQRSLPSFKAGVACFFVVIGFFIGTLSDTDDTSSWQGVACGVVSSLVCAMYGVEVKRALQVLGNDTFKTLYYNTIWGLVMLLPCIWLFERHILVAEVTKLCGSTVHLGFFFFTAIMGFMISISYVLNIRCSSPLTSHIVGSSKSALQSILVLCIPSFQPSNSKEELNVPNLFGLIVVMAASLLYSFFQYQKGQADKSAATKK